MFLTLDQARLPFPVSSSGYSGWESIEISMCFPFFMVKIGFFIESELVKKNLFLSSVDQLQHLIDMEKSGDIVIANLYIMCPKHISGGDEWEMHKLAKLYRAVEPKQPIQSCHVFEISDGRKFVDSILGTGIDEIKESILLYEF